MILTLRPGQSALTGPSSGQPTENTAPRRGPVEGGGGRRADNTAPRRGPVEGGGGRRADNTAPRRGPVEGGGGRRAGYFFFASSLTSPPVDSAEMNASWGTSTRPTIFIRFLPSFCFSSSLRLRLMSPP